VGDLPFVKVPLEEAQAHSATVRRSSRFAAAVAATDPWWTKTTFQVTNVVREDAQREQLGLSVADHLSTHPHVLVSPESTARFDEMVMLGPKEAVTLAITIWAQGVPSAKVESQILSTGPALADYLTSGNDANQNCLEQQSLREARGLNLVARSVSMLLSRNLCPVDMRQSRANLSWCICTCCLAMRCQSCTTFWLWPRGRHWISGAVPQFSDRCVWQ